MDIVLIFFHILILHEYWVLTEIRIPLKLMLGIMRIVALSMILVNRLNKTETAVFQYCRFSLSEGSVFPNNFGMKGLLHM